MQIIIECLNRGFYKTWFSRCQRESTKLQISRQSVETTFTYAEAVPIVPEIALKPIEGFTALLRANLAVVHI